MDLEFFFAYSLGMNKSQEKTITEMTVSEVRKNPLKCLASRTTIRMYPSLARSLATPIAKRYKKRREARTLSPTFFTQTFLQVILGHNRRSRPTLIDGIFPAAVSRSTVGTEQPRTLAAPWTSIQPSPSDTRSANRSARALASESISAGVIIGHPHQPGRSRAQSTRESQPVTI